MRTARTVSVASLLFLTISCATLDPLRQINIDCRESYRSEAFREPFTNGERIGVLTATDGESGVEYKKLIGDFFEEAIRKERSDRAVVPYWQSLSIINSRGYNGEYAEMVREYASTGILDKDMLGRLGSALGVTYFLQPRIISFRQNQSTRFSALGFTLFKTHESSMKIYTEMWHAETGEIVWIGVAETNMASERFMAAPIPFEEIARATVENLVKKMP